MKYMFSLLTLFIGMNASATPGGLYLASPSRIEIVGDKVRLHYNLRCSNQFPEEWAGTLVAVWDDAGDQMIALGSVFSAGSCTPGPLKTFTIDYPVTKVIAEAGMEGTITPANIRSDMFEPIDIRQ